MQSLKVLIVDDSAVYRTQITAALEGISWIELVGTASNGRIALERIESLKPDFVILDLEMPELDGIATLKEMKQRRLRCKTLVFSSHSKKGSEITLQALSLGATDFVAKPDRQAGQEHGDSPSERIRSLILPKLEALKPTQVIHADSRRSTTVTRASGVLWDIFKPRIVVIGSSTGGPTVLEKIVALLRPPLVVPIVIAQHMPPVFTATFAERLSNISGIPALEAEDQMPLESGKIYVAPGDYHVRITGTTEDPLLTLDQGPKINSVRPAVDPLFESAAAVYGERCLAIVLTGMGSDGKAGAAAIKDRRGAVVLQDEQSCVVFGMPGAVFAAGNYDLVGDPEQIARWLNEKTSLQSPHIASHGGRHV
ncbi:MAG: chemotaxis-specific protein-glutamate methyltransferase CheB [Deltaproteobacteria bacterium]|nr:chemotaxis-specific protein-glutamate methyltransferase CheB [Deltaproteobacteria bacterium]